MKPKQPAPQGDTQLLEKTKHQFKRPSLYAVFLHNDDFTTFEFVIAILMGVFHKTLEEAIELTHQVHDLGKGPAGVYPYDIASTKATQVRQLAELNEMPLRVSVEPQP